MITMKGNFFNKTFYTLSIISCIMPSFSMMVDKKELSRENNPLSDSLIKQVVEIERERVIKKADGFLREQPRTVTAIYCSRSQGGKHDYYSEGTYWWPDPVDPDGPYIRKDGIRNHENFQDHDYDLQRFSRIVALHSSAYLLTGDTIYAEAAMQQMEAWFVDTATRMNPHMLYAQAIKGICSGRGIGIIDAVPLIEVALSVGILEKSPAVSAIKILQIKDWFRQFTTWLTTHQYGIDEMNAANNHGTWWLAQVAAYARLTDDSAVLEHCRDLYKLKILPGQMSADGSFPLELERTKPFSYSLYNLDALTASAWILSDKSFDAWNFSLPDGRGIRKGIEFIMPCLNDTGKWPYPKDVANWDDQPGQRPFLLLAALAENKPEWLALWKSLGEKYRTSESRTAVSMNGPILWIHLKNNNLNQ